MNSKPLGDVINDNMKEYARTVVSDRALPSIVDGLKPTARRALYTSKLFYGGKRTKVNELAGRAVKFIPTGDAGSISAISNMAREWQGANNYSLFKPIGAVGSRVFDDQGSIVAARYLSVELSKFAQDFLFSESEVWEMIPNYDESTEEVRYFTPVLPVCLLNGTEGIAFGVSTKIYPRKPSDLVRVVSSILAGKDKIKEPDPWFRGFKGQVIKGPDYCVTIGAIEYVDKTTWRVIDLPIGMGREKFLKKLDKLKSDGKIQNFTDNCTDEFNFTVRVKRDKWNDEMDFLVNAIGSTKLSENINVVDQDKRLMHFNSVVDMLREFVKIKLKTYEQYKLYHICLLVREIREIKAKISAIDNVRLEDRPKTRKTMIEYIINVADLEHGFENQLAEIIAEMKVYHFTEENRAKLKATLNSHESVLRIWRREKTDEMFKVYLDNFKELVNATKVRDT